MDKKQEKIISICDNKRHILYWIILGVVVFLMLIGFILLFTLTKDKTYHIELNSNIEAIQIDGSGNYNEGEYITIKAQDVSGYRFRSWSFQGKEISKSKEYSFSVFSNFVGTYTANYDKLYKVQVGSVENGSITTNKNDAIEGEEITISAIPSVNYELSKMYYVLEGDDRLIFEIDNNKIKMPNSNIIIYADFSLLNEIGA